MSSESDPVGKVDIMQRHNALERNDQSMRTAALKAVSAQTTPLFKALYEECGSTGHKWKHNGYNWDRSCEHEKCVWCGFSEPRYRHTIITGDDGIKRLATCDEEIGYSG